ncbi:hypothetical protein HDU76_011875 [Blyttiomyces sp. JEL0837]|nr:hypothetical protein HDU76_011875 [Blyttiomyces sp. JEL0837]
MSRSQLVRGGGANLTPTNLHAMNEYSTSSSINSQLPILPKQYISLSRAMTGSGHISPSPSTKTPAGGSNEERLPPLAGVSATGGNQLSDSHNSLRSLRRHAPFPGIQTVDQSGSGAGAGQTSNSPHRTSHVGFTYEIHRSSGYGGQSTHGHHDSFPHSRHSYQHEPPIATASSNFSDHEQKVIVHYPSQLPNIQTQQPPLHHHHHQQQQGTGGHAGVDQNPNHHNYQHYQNPRTGSPSRRPPPLQPISTGSHIVNSYQGHGAGVSPSYPNMQSPTQHTIPSIPTTGHRRGLGLHIDNRRSGGSGATGTGGIVDTPRGKVEWGYTNTLPSATVIMTMDENVGAGKKTPPAKARPRAGELNDNTGHGSKSPMTTSEPIPSNSSGMFLPRLSTGESGYSIKAALVANVNDRGGGSRVSESFRNIGSAGSRRERESSSYNRNSTVTMQGTGDRSSVVVDSSHGGISVVAEEGGSAGGGGRNKIGVNQSSVMNTPRDKTRKYAQFFNDYVVAGQSGGGGDVGGSTEVLTVKLPPVADARPGGSHHSRK